MHGLNGGILAALLLVGFPPGVMAARRDASFQAQADTGSFVPRPPRPETVKADSVVAAAADTVKADSVVDALGDTVKVPLREFRRRDVAKRAPVWWTTVRSGILPGWGQLANGKPVKAVLLAGVYGAWAAGAWQAEQDRKDIKDRLAGGDDAALTAELNDAVDRRNFRMWMMGATMLYAMLDAYVDAHFRGYDEMWSAGPGPDGPSLAVTVRF